MPLKVPPPPPIANQDPTFNRWLLELTAILNASGGIDPNSIEGYTALQTQVATNTTDISNLGGDVSDQGSAITALQAQVIVLTAGLASANSSITTLSARPQIRDGAVAPGAGLGSNDDWYADTTAKHIYVKVAGAWVLII